jgi:hypothetical protein
MQSYILICKILKETMNCSASINAYESPAMRPNPSYDKKLKAKMKNRRGVIK